MAKIENLKAELIFPLGWPLMPPMIDITYKSHSWKKRITDWNGAIDLRTIFMSMSIQDDIKNNLTVHVYEQIDLLKDIFNPISVEYSQGLHMITVKYEGLHITVTINREKQVQVDVTENDRNWPDRMIPSRPFLPLNLPELILEVIEVRNSKSSSK